MHIFTNLTYSDNAMFNELTWKIFLTYITLLRVWTAVKVFNEILCGYKVIEIGEFYMHSFYQLHQRIDIFCKK